MRRADAAHVQNGPERFKGAGGGYRGTGFFTPNVGAAAHARLR
jgi:hypothetical protein